MTLENLGLGKIDQVSYAVRDLDRSLSKDLQAERAREGDRDGRGRSAERHPERDAGKPASQPSVRSEPEPHPAPHEPPLPSWGLTAPYPAGTSVSPLSSAFRAAVEDATQTTQRRFI